MIQNLLNHPSNTRILICGPLPPPNYGPSMMYKRLFDHNFPEDIQAVFFNLQFFQFQKSKLVKFRQIVSLILYLYKYVRLLLVFKPEFVMLSISFNRSPFYKDVIFILIAKLFNTRIVQYDMGQYAIEFKNDLNWFRRPFFKFVLNNIDSFIVQGSHTKQLYSTLISSTDIFVLPSAVSDSSEIVTKPRINDGMTKVLFFSMIAQSKGIWTALDAMKIVTEKTRNVLFSFVGAPESQDVLTSVINYVNDNGLNEYFQYHGYSNDAFNRTEHFRGTDVFIFPTLRETFGLVILHAMSEKKPVIASIEGNIPEIVLNGKTGYLITRGSAQELAQKIITLVEDSQLREEMGIEARKRFVEKFSGVQFSLNLDEVLRSIIRKM